MAKDRPTLVALSHFDGRNTRAALKAIGRGLAAMYGEPHPGLDQEVIAAAYARLRDAASADCHALQQTTT